MSVGTLVVSCIGALLTEFSGLAGVGSMIGAPVPATLALVVTLLLAMIATHTYLTVERIAMAVGAFELVFLLVAWLAHPDPAELAAQSLSIPIGRQQISLSRLRQHRRRGDAVDGVLPAILGGGARHERRRPRRGAARHRHRRRRHATRHGRRAGGGRGDARQARRGSELDTVEEIAAAMTPFLGEFGGKLLFGLGMAGASLVAAIVVTLTAARGVAEVLGKPNSLEHSPREAPWFYGAYALTLIAGAIVVALRVDLVSLSVAVQVMNALLLPIVLGFLFLLARRLPQPHRLQGRYGLAATVVTAIIVVFGVFSGIAGIWS